MCGTYCEESDACAYDVRHTDGYSRAVGPSGITFLIWRQNELSKPSSKQQSWLKVPAVENWVSLYMIRILLCLWPVPVCTEYPSTCDLAPSLGQV